MFLVLNGNLPVFYNLLLRPLVATHRYGTRRGVFRHPMLTCEVERRAVAHQMILLYDEVPQEFYNVSVGTAFKKYKRSLLSRL